ncbi:MAG: arylsulfotransferase family protein [Planctomycetota bacterium]
MPSSLGPAARERVAFHLFWVSAVVLALSYGVLAGMHRWFPVGIFAAAEQGLDQLHGGGPNAEWYYRPVPPPAPPPIGRPGKAQPGLNLVTEIGADALVVKVMDLDGGVVQRWEVDWFELWPDAQHVPERLRPRSRPGTHVNGAALMDDGDVVFNFEHLGLLRLDRAGRVVWRLPYQTHHAVTRAADGNLWVCGQKERVEPLAAFPCLVPPFVEDTILLVTPQGRIAREWSVPELLRANGRDGLLCMQGQDNFAAAATGDVTHLNHVEPFPAGMAPGVFGPGDVLVSLRNVHTVFVFDAATGEIGFVSTGAFVRQHDPHFVDGDTISVFDNRNLGPAGTAAQSRIALLSARTGEVTTYFEGSAAHPFFTPILGRHQWLPDGHLLITDSCAGGAFELDAARDVVWWYVNYVSDGVAGVVEQVQRIPNGYGAAHR